MGGSKSSQTQQTSNTSVQQSFVDNSDNSVTQDIFTDNSQVTDIFQDYSDNSEFYQDNSDNRDINNEGMAAGAMVNGNLSLTVTDGGAFGLAEGSIYAMRDTVESALNAGVEQQYLATELSRDAISSNERVTTQAIDQAGRSVTSMANLASDSIYEMRQNSRDVIDGSLQMTAITADTIRQAGQDLATSSQRTTQQAIDASSEAMQRNAALIQTTALGGQDLMIDMVKKVLIGTATALTVGAVVWGLTGKRAAA